MKSLYFLEKNFILYRLGNSNIYENQHLRFFLNRLTSKHVYLEVMVNYQIQNKNLQLLPPVLLPVDQFNINDFSQKSIDDISLDIVKKLKSAPKNKELKDLIEKYVMFI